MNKVVLMGRLTKDPTMQRSNDMPIARYTLAVDRRRSKNSQEQQADFISCVAFGKSGEFAEKYLKKGTKIIVSGRIQTRSYTNKDGNKVYTTDVVAEDQEFAESKASSDESRQQAAQNGTGMGTSDGGFMDILNSIDEELPFN